MSNWMVEVEKFYIINDSTSDEENDEISSAQVSVKKQKVEAKFAFDEGEYDLDILDLNQLIEYIRKEENFYYITFINEMLKIKFRIEPIKVNSNITIEFFVNNTNLNLASQLLVNSGALTNQTAIADCLAFFNLFTQIPLKIFEFLKIEYDANLIRQSGLYYFEMARKLAMNEQNSDPKAVLAITELAQDLYAKGLINSPIVNQSHTDNRESADLERLIENLQDLQFEPPSTSQILKSALKKADSNGPKKKVSFWDSNQNSSETSNVNSNIDSMDEDYDQGSGIQPPGSGQ